MSYWIYLKDKNDNVVHVDNHTEGGVVAIGGTTEAELNVTYNYGKYTWKYLEEGLKTLDGKKAKIFIPVFEKAVNELGIKRNTDYWKPTKGNVGHMFNILLNWAKKYPEAIFEVS